MLKSNMRSVERSRSPHTPPPAIALLCSTLPRMAFGPYSLILGQRLPCAGALTGERRTPFEKPSRQVSAHGAMFEGRCTRVDRLPQALLVWRALAVGRQSGRVQHYFSGGSRGVDGRWLATRYARLAGGTPARGPQQFGERGMRRRESRCCGGREARGLSAEMGVRP